MTASLVGFQNFPELLHAPAQQPGHGFFAAYLLASQNK
jgi:hypothetical protein